MNIDIAKSWLGTPYENNGKVKGVGVDCGRFVLAVAEESGLVEPNTVEVGNYSNEWHLHRNEELMKKKIEQYCDEITEMKVGSILLYQYGRVCSHCGIYIGENNIIHSYIERGVVIDRLDDVIFFTRNGKSRLKHIYEWRV